MRLQALLVLAGMLGCAGPKILPEEPPRACLYGMPNKDANHLFGRILVDACMDEGTDDVLIEHALMLYRGCHQSASDCTRIVCRRLKADEDGTFALPLAKR